MSRHEQKKRYRLMSVPKIEARYEQKAYFANIHVMRNWLLPQIQASPDEVTTGDVARWDNMARLNCAKRGIAVTIPHADNEFERDADASAVQRHRSVKGRTKSLATQTENVALIAFSHAIQGDAIPEELEMAKSLRRIATKMSILSRRR